MLKMEEKLNNKETEKVFATGFKGFDPDMKCRDKQYAENTVFEEQGGNICDSGVMHYCEYPLSVFGYYPPVDDSGKINIFAPVEALAKPQKKEDKSATTKIRIGARIDFAGLAKAAVDFILERVKKEKTKSNTGDYSAATNTGDYSAATNTGYYSAATNTGYQSAATNTGNRSAATNTGDYSAATNTGNRSAASVGGKESFAIATGIDSKVKGIIGCFIACAEWNQDDNGEWHPVSFKSAKVDGKKIKADTWYTVRGGKFVEVSDDK